MISKRFNDWWSKPNRLQSMKKFILIHIPLLLSARGWKSIIFSIQSSIPMQFDREIQTILQTIPPNSTVLDVGSNIGKFTQVFLERGYRVVSVDPLPHAIEAQRTQFQTYIDQDRLTLYHAAASVNVGKMPLFVSKDTNGCYSTLEQSWVQDVYKQHWSGEWIEVETFPLANLIKRLSKTQAVPNCLKIDTEGHEVQVLQGLFNGLSSQLHPKIIMFEFHTQPANLPLLDEAIKLLNQHHYTQFKYIIRYWDYTIFESNWLNTPLLVSQWDTNVRFIPNNYRSGNVLALKT